MLLVLLCFCCHAVINFWNGMPRQRSHISLPLPVAAPDYPKPHSTISRALTPRTNQPSEGPIAAVTKYCLNEVGHTSLAENAVYIAGEAQFVSDLIILPLSLPVSVLSEVVPIVQSNYHILLKTNYPI